MSDVTSIALLMGMLYFGSTLLNPADAAAKAAAALAKTTVDTVGDITEGTVTGAVTGIGDLFNGRDFGKSCPAPDELYDRTVQKCVGYDVTSASLATTSIPPEDAKGTFRRFKIKTGLSTGFCIGKGSGNNNAVTVPCTSSSAAIFEEPASGWGGDGEGKVKSTNFGCLSALNDGKDDWMLWTGKDNACDLKNGRTFVAQFNNSLLNGNGHCADVYQWDSEANSRIKTHSCNNYLNQKFFRVEEDSFERSETNTHEKFKMKSGMGTGFCIGKKGSSERVSMVDCDSSQAAVFVRRADETDIKKMFISQHGCMTAKNDGKDDDMFWANVCEVKAGKFFADNAGKISNSNKTDSMDVRHCADVYQEKTDWGADLKTHSCNDKSNQKFSKHDVQKVTMIEFAHA